MCLRVDRILVVEPINNGHRLGVAAAERLAQLGSVTVTAGLTDDELGRVEQAYGIEFADDHRAFLATGLPLGERWPDWRAGDPGLLTQRLRRPVEGVLFDVAEGAFWYGAWGPRPTDATAAVALASERLASVARLVPVYSHRYLRGGRGTFGNPVLSVVQTDIVVYGRDLTDYIGREFATGGDPAEATAEPVKAPNTVDFWDALST